MEKDISIDMVDKNEEVIIEDKDVIEMEVEPNEKVGGTSNYNNLTNKPQINGVELKGNKTLKDLGIQLERKYIELKEVIKSNTDYTIPIKYKIGNNSLEVFYCGNKLVKDIDYYEIGNEEDISNIIQFTDNIGNLDMSDVEGFENFKETLEFIVRGGYGV